MIVRVAMPAAVQNQAQGTDRGGLAEDRFTPRSAAAVVKKYRPPPYPIQHQVVRPCAKSKRSMTSRLAMRTQPWEVG